MCLLIVIRGADPDYPILVANNRDEFRGRRAAPPGLFVGERRRMISPRDRQAGGTWSAVSDHGMFAGLTNIHGAVERPEVATTRGDLPHLALDHESLAAGVAAVEARCAAEPFRDFQLLVCDTRETAVLVHRDGVTRTERTADQVSVLSNEHALGELALPGIDAVLETGLDVEARLGALKPYLCDEGQLSGHRILKKGGDYGTVSSSLIAVPTSSEALVWQYAVGEPDEAPFRNYGNLGRRLLPQ